MSSPKACTDATKLLGESHLVKIASGRTCAVLGDERTIREHLVVGEFARNLRQAHVNALTLLLDDSLDPLNERQLRVAMRKDQAEIDRFSEFCGKPICAIPDPWGCHASYAEHFEA